MIVGFLADENNKTPLNLGLLVKLLSKNGLVIHGPITKEIPVSETNQRTAIMIKQQISNINKN